jgi:brefeldin A-inhibited guanine nucleotide-exchange protein
LNAENDTLARIGTSCLQQLLENNVKKLSPEKWERIVTTFVKLFRTTTPHQLFDENLRADLDGNTNDTPEPNGNGPNTLSDHCTDLITDAYNQAIVPAPLGSPNGEHPPVKISQSDRRRIFKQIIVKCVLQLLLIETTNDLLRNEQVYSAIPPDHLLRLMYHLDHSYQFARMFNEDKDLRTGLWKVGQWCSINLRLE